MIERLDIVEQRYNEITKLLQDPSVTSDINKYRELSKELSSIEETVKCYHEYKKTLSDLEEAHEMVKDPELAEFAREEIENLQAKKVELEGKLEVLLIPKDENDGKNIIVEIRGAAGGDEANIFAGDLYRMYSRYAGRLKY